MAEKTISDIEFEIGQIERLFREYRNLLARAHDQKPDIEAMTAIAGVLHAYYTGLERIFSTIAEQIDNELPTGREWHRQLLNQMAVPHQNRKAVLTAEIVERLDEYLSFRHFYRHAYSFFLEWEKMEKLVMECAEAWRDTRAEIELFVEYLRDLLQSGERIAASIKETEEASERGELSSGTAQELIREVEE